MTAPLLSAGAVGPPEGGVAEWLDAADGARLRAAFWAAGGRGTALVLPGRAEFIEKHYETVGRLRRLGYGAAAIDWRGQGLSRRALPDRRKGHVGDFSEYQRDLDALEAALAARDAARPWILVGHSMGGAIAARRLMQPGRAGGGRAGGIAAAILSAPMLGLVGPAAGAGARLFARAMTVVKRATDYAPGGGPQALAEAGFETNVLTTDPSRFARFAAFVAAHPDLALGGPTWGWVSAALREMPKLRPTPTPTLALIGEADAVVSAAAVARYVDRAPDAALTRLNGARHEPFMERSDIQDRAWRAIASFLDARAS